MELFAQDEFGRYSTVERTADIERTYTHFFTRDQMVAEIAHVQAEVVRNQLILAMIDENRMGTVE